MKPRRLLLLALLVIVVPAAGPSMGKQRRRFRRLWMYSPCVSLNEALERAVVEWAESEDRHEFKPNLKLLPRQIAIMRVEDAIIGGSRLLSASSR
jgi:hypothetical protein